MTLATGFVFGLVPAFRGSAPNVERSSRPAPAVARADRQSRSSGALVVAEVAFSLILLVGAALLVRTFANLHALRPASTVEASWP